MEEGRDRAVQLARRRTYEGLEARRQAALEHEKAEHHAAGFEPPWERDHAHHAHHHCEHQLPNTGNKPGRDADGTPSEAGPAKSGVRRQGRSSREERAEGAAEIEISRGYKSSGGRGTAEGSPTLLSRLTQSSHGHKVRACMRGASRGGRPCLHAMRGAGDGVPACDARGW